MKYPTKSINPIIMLFSIVILAAILTFVLPSGSYKRVDKNVVPQSYTQIDKPITAKHVLTNKSLDSATTKASVDKNTAQPVGVAQMIESIPEGIAKRSGLIFMVLFIGGMIGVVNKSGAIEAGLERSLGLLNGNIYILAPVLVLIFSLGSTFLGLAKEYLLIIPSS